MQVTIGIDVNCGNNLCERFLRSGKRRHIGIDGGLGGRWQCVNCKRWTERGPTA